MPAALPQPAPNPAERLASIVAGLTRHLGVQAVRNRALAPLLLLVWTRIARAASRFAALARRFPGYRPRPPAPPRRGTPRKPPPRDPLPRQRGWLQARIGGCVAYGEYLRLLLDDPQMTALLRASPQARRLIRPLWRMLRSDAVPEVLRPPPRPAAPLPRTAAARTAAARPGPRGAPAASRPGLSHDRPSPPLAPPRHAFSGT